MKCRIEASFLVPVSFRISCALIPCNLHRQLFFKIPDLGSHFLASEENGGTHSSTEWECTGELLPSIVGVASDRIDVVDSDRRGERRDVEAAAFESIGRIVGIILPPIDLLYVLYYVCRMIWTCRQIEIV